jgi:tetratricopeptide (TPR) repeat protein
MSPRTITTIVTALATIAIGLVWTRHLQPRPSPQPETRATFVGAEACASCHRIEATRWRSSMHARAMERPTANSVKAPFGGETFSLNGVTSTFSRRDGRYIVRTDGPDGVARDFDVAYTFGVSPLQQYLISMPGGRLQALGIAWDSRPAPAGQRWYHLYGNTPPRAGDVLHWTNRSQNWNFMCADCHSTNVRKNYRGDGDRYETTFTDVNVACEACHGPGSRHVTWARSQTGGSDNGLTPMYGFDGVTWTMDAATGIRRRNQPRTSHVEIEMCARCHSRRAQLTDEVDAGRPLADSYRPSLLDEDLYFADGQIDGEVYEYGSFLQSRMYASGVTCSDCHEPHQPELSAHPDKACRRCHAPEKFATPAHHHHTEGSTGSSCVSCHMPSRKYMTVDVRYDHSFRVPRPDLTMKIGTPNTCTSCHANKPASWAAATVVRWFGPARSSQPHYGEALAAGRSLANDAPTRLLAVVTDSTVPAIVRATAVSLLGRWIDARSAPVLARATHDPDALVRMAAVGVLQTLPAQQRASLLTERLDDPARAVRVEAARGLGVKLSEWTSVQRFNADTAAAHVNLGSLHAERGDFELARQEYEIAQRLEPYFAPAAANLADLYRAQGRDDVGERVLREALARTPEVSMLHYALGLLLVRQHDLAAAIAELRQAARLAPGDPGMQSTLKAALAELRQPGQ